jgi:hypothetical protein
MRERNPMRLESARKKMQSTLLAIGHGPSVRGGNGRPLSLPQQMLAKSLGWRTEYIVRTGIPRGQGYPTHYKLDIADPESMIAIEVDGSSHSSLKRQAQDKKKEDFLAGLGWKVLRFKNQEVMENLAMITSTILKLKNTIITLPKTS